jgi:sugar phosphate isomerase/epimerase
MASDGKLRLGVIIDFDHDAEKQFAKLKEMGFPTCQGHVMAVSDLSHDRARNIRKIADKHGVEVTTVFFNFAGSAWDFVDGPKTIGFVPMDKREERFARAPQVADFIKAMGVPSVSAHMGFIPDDVNDPVYTSLIEPMRGFATHCERNGQVLAFETGQETAETLLHTLEAVGTDNVGVNFDPANLLMYGKTDPTEAMDILGPRVMGFHAKDGKRPTEPGKLGPEMPLGQGDVDFPVVFEKLKGFGYKGAITIEREISGPEQITDILHAKKMLEGLV